MFESGSDLPWEQNDRPHAVAATGVAFVLQVEPIDSAHAEAGQQAVMIRIQGGGRVAQQVVPEGSIERFQRLLTSPVQIALSASEEEDGTVDGTLMALVPSSLVLEIESENEPWKRSLPDYEQDDDGARPVFLGLVRRHPQDRKFPEDFHGEVVDLLTAILSGAGKDPVEKMLDSI